MYIDNSSYNTIKVNVYDYNRTNLTISILEHRYVWEICNNACLLPWSIVHHINGIKNDNRPENLQAMMRHQHITYRRKPMISFNPEINDMRIYLKQKMSRIRRMMDR